MVKLDSNGSGNNNTESVDTSYLDIWLEWCGRVNIFENPYYRNEKVLRGGAAVITRISTPEGLASFLNEQELGKFIIGFPQYYAEEVARLREYELFLDFERAGVGNERRSMIRALINLKNDLELQQTLLSIYSSLPEDRDKAEFNNGLYEFFRSNYLIGNVLINPIQKQVW